MKIVGILIVVAYVGCAGFALAAGKPNLRRPPEVIDATRKTIGTATADLTSSILTVVRRVQGGFVWLKVERTKILPSIDFVYRNHLTADCTGPSYMQFEDQYFVQFSYGRVDPSTQQLIDPLLVVPDLTKTPATRTFHSQWRYESAAACAAEIPPGTPGPDGSCCVAFPAWTTLSIEPTTLDVSEYTPPITLR